MVEMIKYKRSINRDYQGYIFDLDGVLWQGNKVISGAINTINEIQKRKKKCMFVTNTSSHSYESCLQKTRRLGFSINQQFLYVATREIALYLAEQSPGCSVYVIGTAELIYELKKAGIKVYSGDDISLSEVKYVVVGNDTAINYSKLTRALHGIRAGAYLVAVNNDLTTPVENNLRPGGGTLVAAVAAMTGHPPDINIAKPKTFLLEKALRQAGLSPESCAMVGDTLDTDIAAGNALGMDTILVLSGNTSLETVSEVDNNLKPGYVIESIAELID